MKPIPENLEKHIDSIRHNLYGAPQLVMQTAEVLGVSLFDAWKLVLEGKAVVWRQQSDNNSGLSDFAAGCAIFAAAVELQRGEIYRQALDLSDALVGHATLAGIDS
jgi:galactitol-specific phosphotransferase system IIC component